jgi:uncharacterized phage protein (TIGR01671 family)
MWEIEFRGKRKDTGEWVCGYYVQADNKHYIFTGITGLLKVTPAHCLMYRDFERYEVIRETVGSYTGIKDKNGVKIFEGDILECERHIPDTNFKKEKFRHEVHFDNGVFYALQEFLFEKTIIGNIHDTPDLLDRNKIEEETE